MSDYNAKVIAEFRANGGSVPNFGSSLVLLHSIGAKSGEPRINPVMGIAQDDGSWLVAASKAGAPDNPAWYFNLMANPDASVETPSGTFEVTASELDGDEYAGGWKQFTSRSPGFTAYQEKAGDRRIPVIRLARRDG
jgi:deazaflavin-dependent oxidoreductase (nitroreductase family)